MNFDPQKFFIGVIDFFSILLPGGLLAYLWKDCFAKYVLGLPGLSLQGAEAWMIFIFLSYLLGHITFLLGSLLDEPYDWIRKSTPQNQMLARMISGDKPQNLLKKVLAVLLRRLAKLLFGKNPEEAVAIAQRMRTRALAPLNTKGAINAFQWCKVTLSKKNPEGLVTVNRFEADSKFFRSFAVVLVALAVFYLVQQQPQLAMGCVVLFIPALWRYADQRFKATQNAYWFTIALDGMSPLSPKDAEADGRTHAGGVVFRKDHGEIEYLLVGSSSNRDQLVLPKGHIEWEEQEKQTAVREVHEESGCWAKIVCWIGDVRFGSGDEAPLVCFFLMELVGEPQKWPAENRPQHWLKLEDALKQAVHDETRKMLQAADKARQTPHKP